MCRGNELTLLGELGKLADDRDLCLALGRLEEGDLALEHGVLLGVQPGALGDAVVVLCQEENVSPLRAASHVREGAYLAGEDTSGERREDGRAEVVFAVERAKVS